MPDFRDEAKRFTEETPLSWQEAQGIFKFVEWLERRMGPAPTPPGEIRCPLCGLLRSMLQPCPGCGC